MQGKDIKTYYTEQRELLRDTFAEIGQKAELILTVGQLLMENGADTSQIIRDMKRAAAYVGIPAEKFHLHIMYTTLLLNISDEHHSHTSFRKCIKHAVDMRIISSVSRLTWRAMTEHYTLDELRGELNKIATRPRFYNKWLTVCAAGTGCGAFSTLFGCDFNAAIYTAISAIVGKLVQMQCVERFGFNPYVSMMFAAFSALSVADLMHLLPTATPWHPMISASLFLVPGIPIINAFSDMLNTYLISGLARILHTLIIVGSTSFGIVFAIGMSDFNVFMGLPLSLESNYLLFATAAAVGAMSFAIFFNVPPRLLYVVALGGAICVCTRNFLTFELGMSSPVGTIAGATLVSVLAVKAIHWLHTPSQVLVVPAVIPLVPGVMIYYSLFATINIHMLSNKDLLEAIQFSVNALLIILAIAIGASMPSIFAKRSFERRSKDKQEKLLNEIYETDLKE